MSQLEEAKRTADEESRERQTLAGQLKNFQHENDSLREQLDDEQEVVNFWESLFWDLNLGQSWSSSTD